MAISAIHPKALELAAPQQQNCIQKVTSAALRAMKAVYDCFAAAAQWVWDKAYHGLFGYGPGAIHPANGSDYSNADMKKIWGQTSEVLKEGHYMHKGKRIDFLQAAKDATRNTVKQGGAYWFSDQSTNQHTTSFQVIEQDAVEVAMDLQKQGFNLALLNPANAYTPGGGYQNGARAMEEDLCRRSSLANAIDHRNGKQRFNFYPLNGSDLLYTRNVPFFRHGRDKKYAFLPEPQMISVITSAAIDLQHDRGDKYKNDHARFINETKQRIYAQLSAAKVNGHDCVVLTAFGCGAFWNKPEEVAQLYKEVINEKFKGVFKNITFAIIDDHNARKAHNPEGNVKPFRDVFGV